ncbi:HIT domain-containing protein [Ramlibacter monticola]|uniref:HIT family protein n=1 Tax=Ramlibacter monticola TaxID=1926872 RepID=A0A937CX08_9BURK|nr:HIT family protein [Ramlibacter monticola]MBL0394187.1 HIT family protein [Ramlibacter monticola]
MTACPLCDAAGGRVVVQAPRWRIVHAQEAGFPAFYRLVWQAHVREFSHLPAAERAESMDVLVGMEQALLRHLQPDKVNLASLGNAVPHLHWHVIGRFAWDSHFPGAVWAQPQRPADPVRLQAVEERLAEVEQDLMSLAPRSP